MATPIDDFIAEYEQFQDQIYREPNPLRRKSITYHTGVSAFEVEPKVNLINRSLYELIFPRNNIYEESDAVFTMGTGHIRHSEVNRLTVAAVVDDTSLERSVFSPLGKSSNAYAQDFGNQGSHYRGGLQKLLEENLILPGDEFVDDMMSGMTLRHGVSLSDPQVSSFPNGMSREGIAKAMQGQKNFSDLADTTGVIFFNKDVLKEADSFSRDVQLVKTSIHEIGHRVSTLTGQADKQKSRSFFDLMDLIEEQLADNPNIKIGPEISLEVADYFKKAMIEAGLEEARAESFGFAGLSKTTIGKEALSELAYQASDVRFADPMEKFEASINKIMDIHLVGGYAYNTPEIGDKTHRGFQNYSNRYFDRLKRSPAFNALAAHMDFEDVHVLAQAHAHAAYMGSVNYGEFTPFLEEFHRLKIGQGKERAMLEIQDPAMSKEAYDAYDISRPRISTSVLGVDEFEAANKPQRIVGRNDNGNI